MSNSNTQPRRQRTVIAAHLIHTLYGHWAVNDPRGSGSTAFIDPKFAPLGPIHTGRKPRDEQPSRDNVRAFHAAHEQLLNFPLIWIDDVKAQAIADAIAEVINERGYTCYACAICSNHVHLIIRTHRDRARAMWDHIAERVRERLRLRFQDEINANHPVISARPYNVLLSTPDAVRACIDYINRNPEKEGRAAQRWAFVSPYDNFPFHRSASLRND